MGRRRFGLAALGLLAGGCNWYYDTLPSPDDLVKAVPWFDHMITSPAVFPYQRRDVPRLAIPGTVPVTGSEGDWGADFQAGRTAVADALVNPTNPATTLARGDTLYHTFCAVCHGQSGAATDAPVGPRTGAPPLLTDKARAYSDGYLYSIIRYGRGVMPTYGDKVYRREDRWAIVNHVRELQRRTPPPIPPAAGTAP